MRASIFQLRSVRRPAPARRPLAPATLLVLLGALAAAACAPLAGVDRRAGTFYSSAVAVGEGTARTYVTTSADGEPVSLGVELSEAALNGLPDEELSLHLPFPREAAPTQYTFMMLDWRPAGHVPEHVYTVPHFDVHFYMVDEDEVAGIPGGPDPIVPEPRYVPTDYIAPGNVAEPGMGVHWVDSTADELHGAPFDQTFIYGFSGGRLIFLEPMITRAYLATHPDFSMPLKQPPAVQRAGYYPLRHRIRHDASAKVFRISIDELTRRLPTAPPADLAIEPESGP